MPKPLNRQNAALTHMMRPCLSVIKIELAAADNAELCRRNCSWSRTLAVISSAIPTQRQTVAVLVKHRESAFGNPSHVRRRAV